MELLLNIMTISDRTPDSRGVEDEIKPELSAVKIVF